MARIGEDYAPYAFVGNVLAVLRRLRNAGLPDIVDVTAVKRVGISEGNASRTLAALQFLVLIHEDGTHTELMDNIERASTDEYPEVLESILREAYSEVFKIIDPSSATEIEINDAFRGFNPSKQRKRMVNLFIGLSQEADIIEGEPTTIQKPKRIKSSSGSNIGEISQTKTNNKNGFSRQHGYNARKWFDKLELMIEQLPNTENPQWTSDSRERWLHALTSYIDLLIVVDDGDQKEVMNNAPAIKNV